MSSPKKVMQGPRGGWASPLSNADLKRAKFCCDDPKFIEAISNARQFVELLPEPISGANMQETLLHLHATLRAASNELTGLPLDARARLYDAARGGLPAARQDAEPLLVEDLALQLDLVAIVAMAASARVVKREGRSSADWRTREAVSRAKKLQKEFRLQAKATAEIASIILGKKLSDSAFRRAANHIKPTATPE